MSALQLILLGEERLCDFPGMTRGLVAVLLYYDTRKTTVETLRELILGECLGLHTTASLEVVTIFLALLSGCRGASWTLETPDDISSLVTEYVKGLVGQGDTGLVSQILALVRTMNWPAEAAKLSAQMALGDARHRSQVEELFRGVHRGLAECLFAISAQLGLSIGDTVKGNLETWF